jgi:hypothetical protein
MWDIDNQTAFATERNWIRDRNGAEVWVVSVKGTYDIRGDDTLALAENQDPVRFGPEYRGDPARSSLLYETDLMLTKAATDVVLNATAFAPYGEPTQKVDVSIRIGNWSKTVRVLGDRHWESFLGLTMTNPEPFERVPITYERAFGGTDQNDENPKKHGWERRNPVGAGFATRAEHLIGRLAPNVEDPRHLISDWKDRPPPAGFGPIPGHWSPRVELAGTYDDRWQNERFPLVPVDFDERFYQFAPVDQQLPNLRGGEKVTLTNLTPAGELQFRLPRMALAFETKFGVESVRHSSTLHSVIIEPDLLRVMMVWQTTLPCHAKVLKLKQTIIRDKHVIDFRRAETV